MRDAVVVDAVRTPIGKRNGVLSGLHPVDLSAVVLRGLAERNGLDPALVEDVVWGCASQVGEQGGNVGRYAALAAGWPEHVPGTSIDRACGSSQQAATFAAAGVIAGQYDVVVCGGVESMSRVPMGSARTNGPGLPFGPSVRERYEGVEFNQGDSAEIVAERWGLSREALDLHALESHERAGQAIDGGLFASEIVPVPVPGQDGAAATVVDTDEGVRRGGTPEKLGALRPSFRDDGVVTAGNSSQISDGAAALLVTTSEIAARHGWQPLARFHSFALAGVDPVTMLTAPIPATAAVLTRAGLRIEDVGAFEVNEAFASVTCAWLADTGADPKLLNARGGAIGLGHPLGASGARLMTTLVHRMRDDGIRYGLQTMCEAGGMANATVLEAL
ncbi:MULTISPECIES: thiolase family protein [unclassified Pseudonocardia]|uniref:thiolase family protein n=1 Tax=unclassified Pseudonocardia TaxID=2619320 RepID=UPI0001FFEF36|nr:thiolase family protein [Pseudonocardia sp. Ae707_Ps1]OLM17354.1 3-ketoacyl-CoA thiolase, Acetyl-CoA acetyltransferase [Pseudonocardia sp. Ae707_Ps1]